MTDGSFSEDVLISVSGTKRPLTPSDLENNRYQLEVLNPEGIQERLEQKSISIFKKVIRSSLSKSGLREKDIDYLAMLHMKKSAHDFVFSELGLQEKKSIYLHNFGHIGEINRIVSLQLALEEGLIQDGNIVTLVGAGIGYVWGAMTIHWG